jgi:Ca2+-binding RTX toxin-like protein
MPREAAGGRKERSALMAVLSFTPGADTLIGGDDEADTFQATLASLTAVDIARGGLGLGDVLAITGGGLFASNVFAGVFGIEEITFDAAATRLTLTGAALASDSGVLRITGGAGDDRIDAGTIALTERLHFLTGPGAGADTVFAGAGDDTITLSSGDAHRIEAGSGDDRVEIDVSLLGGDTLSGGFGTDRLVLQGNGAVAAASFANVSAFEVIELGIGVTGATLADSLAAQPLLVLGSLGGQRLDTRALVAGRQVTFAAGFGEDTMLGGAADERFEISGASRGDLGAGEDTLRLLTSGAAGAAVRGGAGTDTIRLAAGGEWNLRRFADFEELRLEQAASVVLPNSFQLRTLGSAGDDLITLSGQEQIVHGAAGADTVIGTLSLLSGSLLTGDAFAGGRPASPDVLVARYDGLGSSLNLGNVSGFETVILEGSRSVRVNVLAGDQPLDLVLDGAGNVTLGSAVQSVLGSAWADAVRLGGAGQAVETGGGNDTISGTLAHIKAARLLAGGVGTDQLLILGETVIDVPALLAQVADFSIESFSWDLAASVIAGSFSVSGGAGADTVAGTVGNVAGYVRGNLGGGDDVLVVDDRTELGTASGAVSGGAGTDRVQVLALAGSSPFTISARFADFEIIDLTGANPVARFVASSLSTSPWRFEMAGNQTVEGAGAGETFVHGESGGRSEGNGGNDTHLGGAGNDSMFGDAGADSLLGGGGNDLLLGGLENDLVNGEAGNDRIEDDAGADTLLGGDGADTVLAGAGSDSMLGGPGLDTLSYQAFSGPLTISLNAAAEALVTSGDDSDTIGGFEAIQGGSGNDSISAFFASGPYTLIGGFGNDTLLAGADGNLLTDDPGADSLVGGSGNDTLSGGSANDTLLGQDGADSMNGGSGNDELRGGNGADTLIGGSGSDSIWGDAGGDRIDLTENPAGGDRIAYNSNTNGTADINTTQAVAGADRILGFQPRQSAAETTTDFIVFSQAGLGLTGGLAVKKLAANEAWNASTHALFILDVSDDLNTDGTGTGEDFGNFAKIAAGVNGDAGGKSGFVAGRAVVFAMNGASDTGLYLWRDSNGGGALETGDELYLLGVIAGLTTATLQTESLLLG